MNADLWFGVVLLCLVMYVVLDGYDLGIGVNLLLERDLRRQRELVEIVATAWDGNESWLILLGVSLWGGFPLAYGVVLPHLFIPLIVMLFALILRGASIELVSGADTTPRRWVLVFGVGSLVAAFAQGMLFGALTQAVPVVDGAYAGAALDFASPYTVLTGTTAVALYAGLGAAYVRAKADDPLRAAAAGRGRVLLALTAVFSLSCAVRLDATAAPAALSSPYRVVPFVVLVVVAVAGAATAFWVFPRAVGDDRMEVAPFAALIVTVVAGLAALVVVRAPVLLPPSLTIASAAAPGKSFGLLLFGVGLNIPFVLAYNWYAHRVFRGKYQVPKSERPAATSPAQLALSADPGGRR